MLDLRTDKSIQTDKAFTKLPNTYWLAATYLYIETPILLGQKLEQLQSPTYQQSSLGYSTTNFMIQQI